MSVKLLIDLAPRFQAAFGIVPLLSDGPGQLPGAQYVNLYRGETLIMNQPGFEDLQLTNHENNVDLKFGAVKLSKSGSLGDLFAPPPMIGLHDSKNLIITPIDGGTGKVIESYGDAGTEFRIQGLIVDMENHHFPFDKIAQLKKMFKTAGAFEVVSKLFAAWDVSDIYFSEVDVNGIQGFEDTVSYTLTGGNIQDAQFFLNGEDTE